MAHNPAAPRAERFTHRELSSSTFTTHQQQVRHVRARDEQHEPYGGHQREHCRAHVADNHFLERTNDGDEAARHAGRRTGLQPTRQRGDFDRCLLDGDAWSKPGDQVDLASRRVTEGSTRPDGVRGPPHFNAARIIHVRWHHPDDGESLFSERDSAPDDVAGSPVAALPETVADHDHLLGPFNVVGACKYTPENRLDPKHLEKAPGNQGALDVARYPVLADDFGADAVCIDASNHLEQLAGFAHGLNLDVAKGVMSKA